MVLVRAFRSDVLTRNIEFIFLSRYQIYMEMFIYFYCCCLKQYFNENGIKSLFNGLCSDIDFLLIFYYFILRDIILFIYLFLFCFLYYFYIFIISK